MTVALRAHHLLCVLTYVGEGYNAAFIANYDAIVARLAAGEKIRIVDGPDDICAPLCDHGGAHCLKPDITERDRYASRDIEALICVPVTAGQPFKLDTRRLTRLRDAFSRGTIRSACRGCQWFDLCSRIARQQYAGALMRNTL